MKNIISCAAICSMGFAFLQAQPKDVPGLTSPLEETLYFADTARLFERTTELGVLLGGTQYFGDLKANDDIESSLIKPAGGFFIRRHVFPMLAIRANVLGGQLYGDESIYEEPPYHKERAFSFTSTFAELSAQLELDLLGFFRYRKKGNVTYTLDQYTQTAVVNRFRRTFSPYLFGGGGLLMTDAKANFNSTFGENSSYSDRVDADRRDGSGWKQQWGVFAGGGFTFDIGYRWVFGAEMGFRWPMGDYDDYLDGVSQSGNPAKPDNFLVGGITLSYRIGPIDRDADGVPDKVDKCPEIPGRGSTLGCPDADNDVVADRYDECPHAYGQVELAGCPLRDTDEDGTPDIHDDCPDVVGLAFFNGCPDTDADGVEDRQDMCPEAFGEAWFAGCPDVDCDSIPDAIDACPQDSGVVFLLGCPIRDTDFDGIADHEDECPEQFGEPEFAGCPDTDCDGIEDRLDYCPGQKGAVSNKGCPEIAKSDKKKLEIAVKNVQFETGKATLRSSSMVRIKEIASILKRYDAYYIKINGHTDSVGDDKKNMELSESRAQACVDALVEYDISEERMISRGFGETKPIASNKTSSGRAQNRRVEFELYLPEEKAKSDKPKMENEVSPNPTDEKK